MNTPAVMPSDAPESLAAEVSAGRWLIVADTLDDPGVPGRHNRRRGLELLLAAARHRRALAVCALAAASLTMGVSFLVPNTYTAETQLMPPQQSQSALTAMLGQFGELASLAGKDVVKNPSAIYVTLLGSRTVADHLIGRFELLKVYGEKRMSDCRDRLADRTQIETTKEGVIQIKVDDHDAARAAALANGYVEELTMLNQRLAIGEAGQRRAFFEQQVQDTRKQLARAEDAFKQIQEKTGVVQLEAQAQALLEAAVKVRALVAVKEAQLQQVRVYAGDRNPDLVRMQQELAALRGTLQQLEDKAGSSNPLEMPVSKLPQAGLEYIRRLREVKYQEALFEALAKQLEAARVDEAREGSLIQVIDAAVVPDNKSGPRRALLTLLGALAGFLGGWAWFALRDNLEGPGRATSALVLLQHALRSPAPGNDGSHA